MTAAEEIKVTSKQIRCDGGKGAHGHPAVYLTIDPRPRMWSTPIACADLATYRGAGIRRAFIACRGQLKD